MKKGYFDNVSFLAIAFTIVLLFGALPAWALTATEVAKLIAAELDAGEGFGSSVSINGNTAVIGSGGAANSVYVFTQKGSGWTQQAKLVAADTAVNHFGVSVSVSGDTVLVGAHLDSDGGTNAGAAYVFTRNGSRWTQEAKLVAADAVPGDQVGGSVSVTGDTAAVGAHLNDDGGTNAGAVYVFTRNGSRWTQQAKLVAADAASNDFFGISVGVFEDTAIVGAPLDDNAGIDSGAAYVFTRSGSRWTQQAKLMATDGAEADRFGRSVSVTREIVLVGAYLDDVARSNAGSAYMFTRNGSSWTQQDKLVATDGAEADRFGRSVSVTSEIVLVGAYLDDDAGSNAGSAYVFRLASPDSDSDGILAVSDNCIDTPNPDQSNNDGDEQGDACDTDDDNDGVLDEVDNCPLVTNTDQADTDGDGIGDICDDDLDNDSVSNDADNCRAHPNSDQTDTDSDGNGDACDTNDDNDSKLDVDDNCPTIVNDDQADLDTDGIGNACDGDDDNDGIDDIDDNCSLIANPFQDDTDNDGAGDACDEDDDNDGINDGDDNCSLIANRFQNDTDNDGAGDACDEDDDNDGINDGDDNCSLIANRSQNDTDGDGMGDVCDDDLDGDGVDNDYDICPTVPNSSQFGIDCLQSSN